MRILVGYDGSNVAQAALELAVKHAAAFGGTLHVATSMNRVTDKDQAEIRAAEERLEAVKTDLTARGVDCRTHLLIRGMPAGEDLVDFAREKSVDEIVIGVQRRSKVGKLLMGSTAQYVVLRAECPVVTIK